MTSIEKDAFAEKVGDFAEWMRQCTGDAGSGSPAGMCVYSACAALILFRRIGETSMVMQAGSLHWPIVDMSLPDDGVRMTHFSHVWGYETSDILARTMAIASGTLPEVHTWLVDLRGREIIDFTTGRLPHVAGLVGLSWTGEQPPKYVWGSELPMHVHYEAQRQACEFMAGTMRGLIEIVRAVMGDELCTKVNSLLSK